MKVGELIPLPKKMIQKGSVAAGKAPRLNLGVVGLSIGQAQSTGDTSIVEESGVTTSLADKAKEHNIDTATLRKVFNRGMAAYKKSHRKGTVPHQWAHARVNSFLKGGPARKSDQDLWDARKPFGGKKS